MIVFAEVRAGQNPLLLVPPCPSQTFNPDDFEVQKIRQCLGQQCEAESVNPN